MKLLIFLGNPGLQYEKNRHNIGFLVGNEIAKAWNCEQRTSDKRSHALLYKTKISSPRNGRPAGSTLGVGGKNEEDILLIKPQTYMNLSGQSVSFLCNFYKCTAKDIIVIHDDIDVARGVVKYKFGGSAGGQNGVKDIIAKLGTDQFARIRVGVDRPSHESITVSDYVLGNLSQQELENIPELAEEVVNKISEYFFDK